MPKLTEINDKVKDIKGNTELRWKLKWKHDPEDLECVHCIYLERENSIPKNEFKYKDKDLGMVTAKKIKVHRGRYDDVIGWSF